MTVFDWYYVALIASGLLIDHFVNWPALLHRSELDPPAARLWLWRGWMALLWTLVGVGMALWLVNERAWPTLGMTLPRGWRLWVSVALVVGFALHQALTAAKIARMSGPKPKLRAQFGKLAIALPHTLAELSWFVAASLTAGFCEEFLFRGYLIWAFAPLLGWWGAAALSLAAFAAGHTYQGKAGFIRSALAGGVFTALVVLFGSLVPAISLHALVDACGGVIAWLVLREEPATAGLASAGESS
jgi:membrane protease YdiL (CAAX protease family)